MKMIKKISGSSVMFFSSANLLAHPGHEAIGDVLHIEYLFAVGIIAGAIVLLMAWKRVKERH
jgi:predicted MFS family arabinose efflux permease